MTEKYGFVYIWYDRKHKRYYVGCHWGTEDDGYICSSPWLKQGYKHRPQDFKRRILKRIYDKKELLEAEYHYLKMIKPEEFRIRYYNLHNHHFGHWTSNSDTVLSAKEKMSANHWSKNPKFQHLRKKKPMSDETKEKLRQANLGKKCSEETLRKRREYSHLHPELYASFGMKGKQHSEKTKIKMSRSQSGKNNPMYGKTHTPEARQKISENHKSKQ